MFHSEEAIVPKAVSRKRRRPDTRPVAPFKPAEIYTVKEAAEGFKVTTTAVIGWIYDGKLEGVSKPGRGYRLAGWGLNAYWYATNIFEDDGGEAA
jgi:hypothetical protein